MAIDFSAVKAISIPEGNASKLSIGGTTVWEGIPRNLEDATWEQISQVARAGRGADYWSLGDSKTIVLNGTIGTVEYTNVELKVFIIDFNHAENGVANNNIIFLGFKNTDGVNVALVDSHYGNASSDGKKWFNVEHWGQASDPYNLTHGGWAGCDTRYDILGGTSTPPSGYGVVTDSSRMGYDATQDTIDHPVANTIMAAIPSDFRSVLRLRTHYTNNKGYNNNTRAGMTEIKDALSLLTEYEIFGTTNRANQYSKDVQSRMAYFENNSAEMYKQTAPTVKTIWYVADASIDGGGRFCDVSENGNPSTSGCRFSYGIAPVFKV